MDSLFHLIVCCHNCNFDQFIKFFGFLNYYLEQDEIRINNFFAVIYLKSFFLYMELVYFKIIFHNLGNTFQVHYGDVH